MTALTPVQDLYEIYSELQNQFGYHRNYVLNIVDSQYEEPNQKGKLQDWFYHIDPKNKKYEILYQILLNNDAKFGIDPKYTQSTFKSIDNFCIYFLYDAVSNDNSSWYDYIEFVGMRYLIIFMDEFKGLYTPEENESIAETIGDFAFYHGFQDIVRFIRKYILHIGDLSILTSAGKMYQYAPEIIAAKLILNLTGKFAPADCGEEYDYEALNRIINTIPMNIALLGIREYNTTGNEYEQYQPVPKEE